MFPFARATWPDRGRQPDDCVGPLTLRARLLRVVDLSPAQVADWRDLAARAVDPNPFFEPQWVVSAARHLGVRIDLLAVMAGGDMVACMPLLGHERLGSALTIRTWAVPSVLGTPLLDPSYAHVALAAAVELLRRGQYPQKVLSVSWLPAQGVAATAMQESVKELTPTWFRPSELTRPCLRRRPDGNYLENWADGKSGYNLRRTRRLLERSVGQVPKVIDRAGDASVVARFLAMEAAGWKGGDGTAMAAIPGRAKYFQEMCAQFSADGRLRMLCYEAGGTTLAMKCDIAAGPGVFCVKRTYNEQFARYSPGVHLDIEGARVFHESGAAWMDSCTNVKANDPLVRLWPERLTFTNLFVPLGGFVGWCARHAHPLVWLRRKLRTR